MTISIKSCRPTIALSVIKAKCSSNPFKSRDPFENPTLLSVGVRQHSMIDAMAGYSFNTYWEKDVYPAPEFLQKAIKNKELYIARIGGKIASVMALNHECNPEYQDASWNLNLKNSEFLVIHALGVHPEFSGRGCGKAMVEKAIEIARKLGMQAIRLDELDGNIYAERLYTSCGFNFKYVGSLDLYYVDTGRTKFNLFELVL